MIRLFSQEHLEKKKIWLMKVRWYDFQFFIFILQDNFLVFVCAIFPVLKAGRLIIPVI